jgi:hypothetical protein
MLSASLLTAPEPTQYGLQFIALTTVFQTERLVQRGTVVTGQPLPFTLPCQRYCESLLICFKDLDAGSTGTECPRVMERADQLTSPATLAAIGVEDHLSLSGCIISTGYSIAS